ncbi:hypothetical protein B0H14DRAFT_3704962 [Mycena olivaceomarginata]|nr:hypothetical protein B0H14DRAFT_3704962 [Mycena olivaceomarginata]
MVEGNDEQRIEYNMISEELWWDELRMHRFTEMREKQEEPQLRSSGNARGCKELEKAGGAVEYLIDVPIRRARLHHAHARTQHIYVPDRKADHKREGEWPVAAHEVKGTGVAMVRTHAMELVARYGARMRGSIWAGVSCAMGRGVSLQYIWARGKRVGCEAIDEQETRTHIKIGPGAGENGSKEKKTRLTRGTQELAQEWVDR